MAKIEIFSEPAETMIKFTSDKEKVFDAVLKLPLTDLGTECLFQAIIRFIEEERNH